MKNQKIVTWSLAILFVITLFCGTQIKPWMFMWLLAIELYAFFKWISLVYRDESATEVQYPLIYLLGWVGMDPAPFTRRDSKNILADIALVMPEGIFILLFGLIFHLPNASFAKTSIACTEIGCESGLKISIASNYIWVAGHYRFEFTIDSKKVLCWGSLPLKSCDSKSIQCTTSSPNIMIMESGCALPKASHGFGDINITSSPKSVSLQVLRNNKRIGQMKATPDYRTIYPNGKACPSKCEQSAIEITLK